MPSVEFLKNLKVLEVAKKIILILSFMLSIGSYAEGFSSAKKIEETESVNNKVLIELKAQLKEMKMRNELLELHQSSLLSTVHWSLSFLGGITLLLIGYGWWSNAKVHDKDKQQLKHEIATLLGEWEVKIKLDNADVLSENSKSVDHRLSRVDEQLRSTETRVDEQVRGLEKSLDKKLEQITGESKNSNEKLTDKVNSIAELTSQLSVNQNKIESDMLYVEERVWDIKAVIANVLLTQANGLDAARKLGDGYGYRIELILQRSKRTLEDFIKKESPTLKSFFVEKFKGSLNSLDNTYSVKVAEILALLEKVQIKDVE